VNFAFRLLGGDAEGPRLGLFTTPHGEVPTPAFMAVATRGMLRGISPAVLRPMGASIVLSNALHLFLRPGPETVRALGGIHGMLAWDGAVLTDSGGFQIFSLASLCRVTDAGVFYKDPVRGRILWTPEKAFEVQAALGPDIAMVLDHCPVEPTDKDLVAPAVARTLRWGRIQRDLHAARGGTASGQALFGIVQGGVFPDLREECARGLREMEFDGYAVGGVSLGEGPEAMMDSVRTTTARLPRDRVRYLMGVGSPRELVEAVARGIDLFDCVFPTRTGRFATALTWGGRLHLKNARFREDCAPIEPGCPCLSCQSEVPRGALRAGFLAGEFLPPILVSQHNLHFTLTLMGRIRESLQKGSFPALAAEIRGAYPGKTPGPPPGDAILEGSSPPIPGGAPSIRNPNR